MLLIILSSCSPGYVPNIRHAPLFTAKNQVEASVGSGMAFSDASLEAHAAYSLTNHFAVMANGMRISRGANQYKRAHYYTEGAIGYYSKDELRRIEIFAGYGQGKDYGRDNYSFFGVDKRLVESTYTKFFLQPSVCTRLPSTKTNVIFSFKTSVVRPNEFITHETDSMTSVHRPGKLYLWYLEPAVTTSFYMSKNFRGFVQLGINLPIDMDDENNPYDRFFPVQVAFGLQFSNIR